MFPAVGILQELYEYSIELADVVPKLLTPLCSDNQNMQNQTALAKLLCDLFNFVIQFDALKMVNPHIQNDFSYFRRSMNKLKSSARLKVPDDVANKMSLFYAYPTPMMNSLLQLVKDTELDVVLGLSMLANVCLDMVEKNMFENNDDLNMFCLRAMCAAIVVVDHTSDNGVFCRKSPINVYLMKPLIFR